MAGAFDAKVDISTAQAIAALGALRKEVTLLGSSLKTLDGIIKANKGNMSAVATQFTGMIAQQRAAASATRDTAQANIASARASAIQNTAAQNATLSAARTANQQAQAARAVAQTGTATARTAAIQNQSTVSANNAATATARASAAQSQMNDGLSNSRYLMYDVGQTYTVLAAALMTIPAATAAVAAAYQRDFAQVLRVTEDLDKMQGGAQGLKDSLKDLAVSMPVGFDELTRITQLGAQMGVANDKLVTFTETTAKFVAVTGISADTGATLFGRLETSFTDNVKQFPDFFERIGSSIAYVGAKTVATDPEIASMLSQIGPLGAAAGMSAANVTGLAAALASVRVQPELARGTLTRVFGQLNRDVAEGSPKMEEFGKLMGLTGDAAGKLWQSDSSKFFTDLIKGLNATQARNGELTTTFDKLGITASRDVSALTKLAVGYDVLDLSMTAANKGFSEGTALNDMSKPIFETVTAKLTEFANAWKNLGDTIGAGGLAPLGIFVDMAKNLAIGLSSLAEKVPPIKVLLQALMGFAAVTALFLGFKAAQAFVMAGMIGFQQAATRGMGGGLALGNTLRTLAQTMLVAKGATDQQSRALLEQVGVLRGLMIATTTSSEALKSGAAGSFGVLNTATGKATGGIKGLGSAMLGMAGGPIGIAITALALLSGAFLNSSIEAEQAGKTIADAMAQGAESGMRAIATVVKDKKAGLGDSTLVGWGTSMADIADSSGIGMDKVVAAISKGKKGIAEFQQQLEDFAKSKGYESLADMGAKNTAFTADGVLGAKLDYLKTHVNELGGAQEGTAKSTDIANKALAKFGITTKATGEEDVPTATTALDKMTKALKDLNDQVFGTINAEADLQGALAKVGEGLQKSSDFNPYSSGGRDNIKNFEDTLTKARDYYNQLMTEGTLTAQEAATGYSDFIQGLINEIKAKGGDTSGVEALAANTKAKFQAAIGGNPVMLQVTDDPVVTQQAAFNTVNIAQEWLKRNPNPKFEIGANADPAYAQMDQLIQGIMGITGLPYNVVMDALTDPASEKGRQIESLLISITTGTYVAPVDADTSAAIANVQNFVAYARTELAHLQTELNGNVGLADGEGSMSPSQKAQFGAINTPTRVVAPAQVHSVAAPAPTRQQNFLPGLGNVADGYDKAAEAAKKAGDAGKKAGQDMANGINDAVAAAEDYGNRLKTGLMSAYNQQYGLTKATDDYHSALNAITKKREDELAQLDDLRLKMKALNDERDKELITANKAKIEAGISMKYGEVARAGDYENQAQTALDNAAAKQKDIDATAKSSKELADGMSELNGYTDAAIANREALRGLETKMIDMVAAYAATGASQEEVRSYAQKLTAQFQVDAAQISTNRGQVSGLIGDMGRYVGTINAVPLVKPTTMTANVDNALAGATAANNALDWAARNRNSTVSVNTEYHGSLEATGNSTANNQPTYRVVRPDGTRTSEILFNKGGQIPGFASGGQIPGNAPANPREDNLMAQVDGKGMIRVRSKEFIEPQEAVDYYGLDFMNAIRTLSLPKFNMGGSVGGSSGGGSRATGAMVVTLDADSRAAIQRAGDRPVVLFADAVKLAESTNYGNTILASTGAN